MSTTPQATVEDLDTSLVSPPPGNRVIKPSDVEDLLVTMGDPAIGQRVPGIVFADPEAPGRYVCGAGARRLLACRILARPFKAILAPGLPTPLAVIDLRLTENVLRKQMSPREIAADLADIIRLGNVSQCEAGERYGYKAPAVSKLLRLLTLSPAVQAMVDDKLIGQDAGGIIASLPTPEMQLELAERAVRDNLKRDAVEAWAARIRCSRRRVEVRDRKVKEGPATVTFPGDWTNQRAADALTELAKKLRRGESSSGLAASA